MLNVTGVSRNRKLAILVAVAAVLLISWSGIIDELSRDYVNTSTLQALAAYASARLLNALVSVASSITFSAQMGVGFDIQPFQILDPINDLVEQYSTAMKIAISSLIVQKILIEAVSTLIFKVALTVLSFAFAASLYVRDGAHAFTLFRLFCLFAMLRFLIVLVVLLNAWVDQAFVDTIVSPQMEEVSQVAGQLNDEVSARDKLSSLKNMAQWERITESVEQIVPAILNLMAAFILKTLILPLVFLALLLKGFRHIWGVDPRSWIRQEYREISPPKPNQREQA